MKSRNLFIGIIILFVGVVALLASLGVISFSWSVAWRLWPLLLILLGVAILPISDYFRAGLLVLVLGAGCLLYHHEAKVHPDSFCCSWFNHHTQNHWDWDDDDDAFDGAESCTDGPYLQEFSESYGDYAHATLFVDFGAGEFDIKQPCAELVKVYSDSDFVKYDFLVEKDDESATVRLTGKGDAKNLHGKVNNKLDIALNAAPLWTVNIETGASDCDFDFSPYKVEKLTVETGVSDMEIRLGDRDCNTELVVDSGVSNIEIEVPASMGCKIIVDSALSSKDFQGFEKVESGVWQTVGYSEAEHTIVINLDCGVSNIEVERY